MNKSKMNKSKQTPLIHRLLCLSLIGCTSFALAKEPAIPSGTTIKAIKTRDNEPLEDTLRLQKIAKDATTVAGLLASELLLQTNKPYDALGGYLYLFNTTERPEIANRAMQLALSIKAMPQAEAILEKWKTLEPLASGNQKQMAWEQDIALGKTQDALTLFPELLEGADTPQIRRIFLLVTQLAFNNMQLAPSGAETVHRYALKYPDIQEAAIADTIYSILNKEKGLAIKALQRMAYAKDNMQPATRLTLDLLLKYEPNLLKEFFKKTQTHNLPDFWQSIHVTILIRSNEPEKAYHLILEQLNKSPTVELYTQAGYLAAFQKEPLETILNYFDKAYALGNQQEQSKAALFAAISALKFNDYKLTATWTDRIKTPEYQFDALSLKTIMAAEDKDWKKVKTQLDLIEKLELSKGVFFGEEDVYRLRLEWMSRTQDPLTAIANLSRLLEAQLSLENPNKDILSALYYKRAMIFADDLHNPDGAALDLTQFLKLNPESAIGLNSLGYTLLAFPDRREEALTLLKKAHEKEPNSPAIQDSLGWAYFLKGQPRKALPYLRSAFKGLKIAETAAHLGAVLWTLGKEKEAKAVWQEGLSVEPEDALLKSIMQHYLGNTN